MRTSFSCRHIQQEHGADRPLCRKRQPLVGLARSNLGSYVGRGLALRRQRRGREAKNVACILCFVQADVVTVAEVVGILKMA
jgi:hypothetical protein